jgi:hypothetical protein
MAFNYNQSDPIYKNTLLGNSKKYSLYSDGCYVFSLAFILGIDPIECNNILKAADCFSADSTGDKCLLDHTKIAGAFPKLISGVDKVEGYDNQKCIDAIALYGKVIVYVDYDGNPVSAFDTHFVTFIGGKQLFDSLGGKIKPTSTYPLLKGLRIVKLIPQPATPPETVEKLPKDNVIRDIYTALCGGYSEDEINWRMASGKNLVEIITDIVSGDSRFYDKWVKPHIPAPTPPPAPPPDPNVELQNKLIVAENQITVFQRVILAIKNILYGKGWPWTKVGNLKKILPQ